MCGPGTGWESLASKWPEGREEGRRCLGDLCRQGRKRRQWPGKWLCAGEASTDNKDVIPLFYSLAAVAQHTAKRLC